MKKIVSCLASIALSILLSIPTTAMAANPEESYDIASLLEAGGTIPAGYYQLTRGVKVTNDVYADGVVIDASGCPKNTIAIVAKANITGITINYPQRQGISVQSCSGKTLENCTVTHAQFAGIEVKNNVSDITLRNCISNDNYDYTGEGENADGFGIKNGAYNITLINCSATGNSDDGFDCYSSGENIIFRGCTAVGNGSGTNGDGNGFKLGPCSYKGNSGGLVTVTDCTAMNNSGWGFLRNHNIVEPIQYGNTAENNRKGQFNWNQ